MNHLRNRKCQTDVCGLKGYCCSLSMPGNQTFCPDKAVQMISQNGDFCVEPKNKCSSCWENGFTTEGKVQINSNFLFLKKNKILICIRTQ